MPLNKNIHVHVPYLQLSEHLEFLIQNRINPEVFFPAEAFDQIVWEELSAQARLLHSANLSTTIHAPFQDLNPGALDATIREATRRRFLQVFKAAEMLRPRVIVFHPGFDELRYAENRMGWLKNSIDFWREFLPRAKELGCIIAVENIFDKEPSTLRGLLEAIDDPSFRHCFDVGHWNMFKSVTMDAWFETMGSFIAETHIHDNHGQVDEHLPLGEGEIEFDRLFPLLKRHAPDSVWTIEAHSLERRKLALTNIEKYL